MLLFAWLPVFLAVVVGASPFKVRLNPSNIRATPLDPDYDNVWTIGSVSSANITINGIALGLSIPSADVFKGTYYKLVYTRFSEYLGERVVAEGVSTDSTTGDPITLTIQGLAPGNHTLLTFHNAWDKLAGATNISISVDGSTAIAVCFSIRRALMSV